MLHGWLQAALMRARWWTSCSPCSRVSANGEGLVAVLRMGMGFPRPAAQLASSRMPCLARRCRGAGRALGDADGEGARRRRPWIVGDGCSAACSGQAGYYEVTMYVQRSLLRCCDNGPGARRHGESTDRLVVSLGARLSGRCAGKCSRRVSKQRTVDIRLLSRCSLDGGVQHEGRAAGEIHSTQPARRWSARCTILLCQSRGWESAAACLSSRPGPTLHLRGPWALLHETLVRPPFAPPATASAHDPAIARAWLLSRAAMTFHTARVTAPYPFPPGTPPRRTAPAPV